MEALKEHVSVLKERNVDLEESHEKTVAALNSALTNNTNQHHVEIQAANDRYTILEEKYQKAVNDLATSNSTTLNNIVQHKLEIKQISKDSGERFSDLERKYHDLEKACEETVAESKAFKVALEYNTEAHHAEIQESHTKFQYAMTIIESLEEKSQQPPFSLQNFISSSWARYGFFALLLFVFAAFISTSSLSLPRAVYDNILAYFSQSSVAPVSSIDAFSRLQSAVSPVCLGRISIDPDFSEMIVPEDCLGGGIVCWLVKGWSWAGARLW